MKTRIITKIMQINGLDSAIELELKNRKDIKNCPEGAIIMIGDYVGRFAGIHDEGVRMRSITRKITMGFDLCEFDQYWEQLRR